MKLVPASRRIRLALAAALPITATIAIVGSATPASAWQVTSTCNNYHVCFYGNTGYNPTSEQLNTGTETINNWTGILIGADVACTQGGGNGMNWNDCASSIKSRQTVNGTCVYSNTGLGGQRLYVGPGFVFIDLTKVSRGSSDNWNDAISSSISPIPIGGSC